MHKAGMSEALSLPVPAGVVSVQSAPVCGRNQREQGGAVAFFLLSQGRETQLEI